MAGVPSRRAGSCSASKVADEGVSAFRNIPVQLFERTLAIARQFHCQARPLRDKFPGIALIIDLRSSSTSRTGTRSAIILALEGNPEAFLLARVLGQTWNG